MTAPQTGWFDLRVMTWPQLAATWTIRIVAIGLALMGHADIGFAMTVADMLHAAAMLVDAIREKRARRRAAAA